MFIHHPENLYSTRVLFSSYVDFLIRLINEDRIEVAKDKYTGHGPGHFEIWLIKSNDIKQQLKISFSYESYKLLVGSVEPIQRFRFELIKGVISLLLVESDNSESYDKMLELFKALLGYIQRHDSDHYKDILKAIDLSSLERNNWEKSKEDIQKEVAESLDIRMATVELDRRKENTLVGLTNNYKSQGYQITD